MPFLPFAVDAETSAQQLNSPVSDEALLEARTRLFVRQRPMIWIGQLSVATLLTSFLWWQNYGLIPWFWLLAQFSLAALRLRDIRYYQRHDFADTAERKTWLHRLCVFTGLSGCIWGSAGLFFIDSTELPATLMTMTALMGVATGALPALTAHFPAYASFAIPIALGVGCGWLMEDSPFSFFIAFFGVLTGIMYLVFAYNFAKATTRSISMEHEIAARYEKVAQLKEQAELASKEKTRFLAAISHDVSQPLYSMILFLETLRQQIPDKQRELVDKIESNTRTLHEMFNSIVEVARLEQGTIERHERAFDLDGVINNLANEFRPLAVRKNLDFLVQAEANMIVYSDSVLLARILRNLISNAIKYTGSGWVRLRVSPKEDEVAISVSDSGCGIPEDNLKDIFREYWRADAQRHAIKGLGLGLSVVSRLSQLLGHKVTFHSELTCGTEFTVYVKQAKDTDVTFDKPLVLENFSVAGLHILVLEDDLAVREAMVNLLASWKCLVSDGADVTQLISCAHQKTRPPDILISDYRLGPELDGILATQQLRQHFDPQLPCLIVSGDFDESVINRIKQEALHYLPKPVVPHTLRAIISECV